MKSKPEPEFVRVLETHSLTDVALIKSALDAHDIRYYIQGENMIFIRPLDPAVLMVANEDAKKAFELLEPLKLKYARIIFGAAD